MVAMAHIFKKGQLKLLFQKDQDIEKITFEEALILISNKEASGKGKKKTAIKKTTVKKTSEKKVATKKTRGKKESQKN